MPPVLGRNMERAAVRHRLNAVFQQVEKTLLEILYVSDDDTMFEGRGYMDRMHMRHWRNHLQHFLKLGGDINRLGLFWRRFGKRQIVADDGFRPLEFL